MPEVNREFKQNVSATAISLKDAAEKPLELDSEFDEKRSPLAGVDKRVRVRLTKWRELPHLHGRSYD